MSKFLILLTTLGLAGCVCAPPSREALAKLPIVEFPNKPTTTDFVYKLPAGKPIPVKVSVTGDLLSKDVDDTLTSSLKQDLYIHKGWASEDGIHWKHSEELVKVGLTMSLPSDESPKPGEILLKVDRAK